MSEDWLVAQLKYINERIEDYQKLQTAYLQVIATGKNEVVSTFLEHEFTRFGICLENALSREDDLEKFYQKRRVLEKAMRLREFSK